MHNYVSPDPEAIAMRDSNDKVIERKLVTLERKVDYCLEQGFVPFCTNVREITASLRL